MVRLSLGISSRNFIREFQRSSVMPHRLREFSVSLSSRMIEPKENVCPRDMALREWESCLS